MNTPKDPIASEAQPLVNEQRRRLTRGGLAAPVVLGALLSRPVLGANAPHKCTISGQLSGNVSTHGTTVQCSSLGLKPSDYASMDPAIWPNATNDFLNPTSGNPRQFSNTPFSFAAAKRFADAYEKEKITGTLTSIPPKGTINPATVWDVLAGFVVNTSSGAKNPNWRLQPKSGFHDDELALGQEAVAAYMNAVDGTKGYPGFPISGADVVAMFNSVITGGLYHYSATVSWDATQVLKYFRSLHL